MSESGEMYLLTIAKLAEAGVDAPVPLSRLAEELSVLPVSANQMIRKLDEEGMVKYLPYKGAELTEAGRQATQRILRKHRLWEVFLVDHLSLSFEEAHELACRIEHVCTEKVTENLANFLGEPDFNPEGRPIPSAGLVSPAVPASPLGYLKVGQRGEIVNVETETAASAFLEGEGIVPGAEVSLLAVSDRGAALLEVGERQVSVIKEIVDQIAVRVSGVEPEAA